MSRDSRFDKLEHARAEKPPAERKGAAERFAEAPTPAAPSVHPPAMEAALEASPSTSELKRFEVDGANHLSLDTDELVRLPFRRCPECARDSSKFDRECIFCHASLETPAARDLNLSLLATSEADKAREAQALIDQHSENIKQIVDEEFKRRVEAEREADHKWQWNWRIGAVVGALCCFAVALAWRSFCPTIVFGSIGVALVVVALPEEARKALMTRARPRWRL